MTEKRKTPRDMILIVILITLSIIGNAFPFQLFFGIDFIFGSIFAFLAARVYGLKAGLAAAVLSSSYTIFLWHHPFGLIVFAAELIAVTFFHKKRGYNVILIDIFFWLFAGIPLVFLSYSFSLDMNFLNALLIALKDSINGLFNILVFSLLHLVYQHYILKEEYQRRFQELLFITFSAVFLIPSLFLLIYEGNKEYHQELMNIESQLDRKAQIVSSYITNWKLTHEAALSNIRFYLNQDDTAIKSNLSELGGSIPLLEDLYVFDSNKKLTYSYLKKSGMPFYPKALLNSLTSKPYLSKVYQNAVTSESLTSIVIPVEKGKFKGFIVGTYNMNVILHELNQQKPRQDLLITVFDQNLFQHYQLFLEGKKVLPPAIEESSIYLMQPKNRDQHSKISIWRDSYLVEKISAPSFPWSLTAKSSIEPYQAKLYENYTAVLITMLFIIIAALLIAYWLSRTLVSSIKRLLLLTDQLSAKKLNIAGIQWPESSIREVSRLIASFKRLVTDFNRVMNELRHKQKKLEYFAHFDVLTNMHNRYSFSRMLEKALQKAKRDETLLAVMFCDLDRFKLINDSLGHEIGDELLKKIADKIRFVCGEEAIFCRHGGDEFLVAIPKPKEAQELEKLSKELLAFMGKPIKVEDNEVTVTCSIGISIYPYHAETIESLISTADLAMYSAKEKGKNTFEFFNPVLNENLARKLVIENELVRAYENNEFSLYYQPQVLLDTKEIVGAEALLRWDSSRLGRVSPAEFIPVAEETGFIRTLGEWVINQAAIDLNKLRNSGFDDLSVAVNISIKQFYHQSLPDVLNEKLREYALPTHLFKVEITESVVIDHLELVLNQLQKLKELGIEIALDDFGTGYSSLNYLKKLPIDILKIDRSFIQEITEDQQDAAIVQAVINIANSMNLTVIAEGLEAREQAELLGEIGCQQGQGYFFSRPVPLEEFMELLENERAISTKKG